MKLRAGVPWRIQAKTGLSKVLLAVAAGMEPDTAAKTGLQDGGECLRLIQQSLESQARGKKALDRKNANLKAMKRLPPSN